MAEKRGKPGPKPKFGPDIEGIVRDMIARGHSDAEIAQFTMCSRSTVYRLRKHIEYEQREQAEHPEPEKGTLAFMIWVSDRCNELYDQMADADDAERHKLEAKVKALKLRLSTA